MITPEQLTRVAEQYQSVYLTVGDSDNPVSVKVMAWVSGYLAVTPKLVNATWKVKRGIAVDVKEGTFSKVCYVVTHVPTGRVVAPNHRTDADTALYIAGGSWQWAMRVRDMLNDIPTPPNPRYYGSTLWKDASVWSEATRKFVARLVDVLSYNATADLTPDELKLLAAEEK